MIFNLAAMALSQVQTSVVNHHVLLQLFIYYIQNIENQVQFRVKKIPISISLFIVLRVFKSIFQKKIFIGL
jgi:hypothetical protein